MRFVKLSLLLAALALSSAAGCAAETANPESTEASESDLSRQLSDRALQGKLRGILSGVTFMSEADYEYVVFEGDTVSQSVLTQAIVRQKLADAVMENNSSERDIRPASCRGRELNVDETIADGDSADTSDPEDSGARHDRQVGIALKVMRSQLKSVVGFTFGTNPSGDMDDVGTVLYVYVGISKTTGKLIAIMTEAVYT